MGKKTIISASDDIILQLKVLNQERESIRRKLEITAKNLAVIAKQKEDVRKKLAVTAGTLRLKARNLATIAKEKENVRKELSAVLKQLYIKDKQLVDSTKEMEAFSYSVSHDLRAPLRAIDGFVQILIDTYAQKLDDEGRRLTSIIHASTVQMGKLIDDLLSFSRLGRKEITKNPVNMNMLADQIYKELRKSSPERNIEFIVSDLQNIKADKDMMRVVWTNLLSNAIKFTGKKAKARIEVGSKADRKNIIYHIKDNGAGFDMNYADKLFGVFARLHSVEEFEGTGIGLANVKRIIERHGGKVWAKGKVGQGATVYFSLPKS